MACTARVLIGAAALMLPLAAVAAPAARSGPTCTGFMQSYAATLGDIRVSFERPLTITRDLLGSDDGIDVHVMTSSADVDGSLKCKGEAFRRFEVRIAAPADAATLDRFTHFEQGALTSVFGLDRGKAAAIVKAMSADAEEYLAASVQRGDAFHAGKVEYHQGANFDLGLIWTETDHTFIITSQDEP